MKIITTSNTSGVETGLWHGNVEFTLSLSPYEAKKRLRQLSKESTSLVITETPGGTYIVEDFSQGLELNLQVKGDGEGESSSLYLHYSTAIPLDKMGLAPILTPGSGKPGDNTSGAWELTGNLHEIGQDLLGKIFDSATGEGIVL